MDINKKNYRIIVITPAKNEERFISYCIKSIIQQSIKPDCYIIVDDASDDNTFAIASTYAKKYPWIKVFQLKHKNNRNVGAGVAKVLIHVLKTLKENWDIVIKVDADTILEKKYIEKIINMFLDDSKLGVASGTVVGEISDIDQPRGTGMAIRKVIWEKANLKPIIGWDSYLKLISSMYGFKNRCFQHIKMYTLRKSGVSEGSKYLYMFKRGIASWILSYRLSFVIKRSIKMSIIEEKGNIFYGVWYIVGYIYGFLFLRRLKIGNLNYKKWIHSYVT